VAVRGYGYFDRRGQFFKSPEEATISDIAALLGRVGEGDSLAPGIAKILLDRRREIENVLADHDAMVVGRAAEVPVHAAIVPNNHDAVIAHFPTAKKSA
jgi:hypothetical protein